jgi:two-component system cell cycle response regulator DivK
MALERGENPVGDKKKVIIIDDEPDIVTFLTVLLEDNGYSTVSARDGKEGLEKVETEQPDLILLDITMPEKSGVRCYRELRENPDLKSIPIIIVTGVAKDFEKFISTRRQVPPPDAYVAKPIDQQKLLDEVSRFL